MRVLLENLEPDVKSLVSSRQEIADVQSCPQEAEMPTPDAALPGRTMPVKISGVCRKWQPDAPALPGRPRDGAIPAWAATGAERKFTQAPASCDGGPAIQAATRPMPPMRSLFRRHRPHRGGAGGLYDPEGDQLRIAPEAVLGRPQSDPGRAAAGNDVGSWHRSGDLACTTPER